MPDDPFRERLKRLEGRIEAARGPKPGDPRRRSKAEATALGWRMVTELLAGMLLGLAIGYGLDSLFGTLPLFLVVFALLGFAAGVRTMLRSVDEVRGRKGRAVADGAGGAGDGAGSAGGGAGGAPPRARDDERPPDPGRPGGNGAKRRQGD